MRMDYSAPTSPPNIFSVAFRCLMEPDPDRKVAQTRDLARRWRNHELAVGDWDAPVPIPEPGRPPKPELVHPKHLPRRTLAHDAGRAALIHAVTHIEFNAINLAWDAVYRFRDLPTAYYDDWIGVADDEARHFLALRGRLRELGFEYGDFPAHNGLWDMALRTADDPLSRMALVPRVLEARGLDVTPAMIERFRAAGDEPAAGCGGGYGCAGAVGAGRAAALLGLPGVGGGGAGGQRGNVVGGGGCRGRGRAATFDHGPPG